MIKTGLKQVHIQLEFCLIHIATKEFPEGWPIIVEQVKSILSTAKEAKEVYAALAATYRLSKLYMYEIGKKHEILDILIKEHYSYLLQLGIKLAATPNEESACLLKIIAKTFSAAIHIEISPLLAKEDVFMNWLEMFRTAFAWPLDSALETPTDDEELIRTRSKVEVMKMKKAISNIFFRIFQK